jgi:TetR/AcrR family transcriptional regulator, transcriptional repressor for nem operon
MGRPVKFDRTAAIDKVMHLIWRDGYLANSVKSLSEALGITRSSFYNAFGSREALFREALDHYANQSPDRALMAAEHGVPVRALLTCTFRAAVRARIADKEARGCLFINAIAELSNVDEALSGDLENMAKVARQQISEILTWGVQSGELAAQMNVPAMAMALQGQLFGLNIMSKLERDEDLLWQSAVSGLKGLGLYDKNFSDDGNNIH